MTRPVNECNVVLIQGSNDDTGNLYVEHGATSYNGSVQGVINRIEIQVE